jgi:hypothetical protein
MKAFHRSILLSLTWLIASANSDFLAKSALATAIAQTENTQTSPNPNPRPPEQLLEEGDRLYLGGQYQAAQELYRQAKPPFATTSATIVSKKPIYDLKELAPAGRVYWRIARSGLAQGLESKIFVPLKRLVENHLY